MSIKADRWIKEQCTPPEYVVTHVIPEWQKIIPPTLAPVEKLYFSTDTADEIIRNIDAAKNETCGPKSFREATTEERLNYKPMIEPFESNQVRTNKVITPVPHDPMIRFEKEEKVISYGTSSYGYDVRIANEFKIFTNINSTVINPKNFDPKSFVDFQGDVCIIPPNSFVLARSLEYFRMPKDVTGLVLGKSTYARCGIVCIATPLECGWEGHITLEFANTTPLPAMLFANEGAAQVLFFQGDEVAEVSYATRGGKYQGQTGITLPKA